MKYLVYSLFLFLFTYGFTSAFQICEEINPRCAITGETYTDSCYGSSDTTSWTIPKAYNGKCDSVPEISNNLKKEVFKRVDSFFTNNEMYRNRSTQLTYKQLNRRGQDFVNNNYFPAIKKYILLEREKRESDKRKIAILQSMAGIVTYDYEISEKKYF